MLFHTKFYEQKGRKYIQDIHKTGYSGQKFVKNIDFFRNIFSLI